MHSWRARFVTAVLLFEYAVFVSVLRGAVSGIATFDPTNSGNVTLQADLSVSLSQDRHRVTWVFAKVFLCCLGCVRGGCPASFPCPLPTPPRTRCVLVRSAVTAATLVQLYRQHGSQSPWYMALTTGFHLSDNKYVRVCVCGGHQWW